MKRKTQDKNASDQISFEVPAADFVLKHIFECGQCFRWEREENNNNFESYFGIAGGRVARVSVTDAEKESTGTWKNSETCGRSEEKKVTLRIDQFSRPEKDSESNGNSFIISQNNNIPRIKKNIRDLAKLAGKPVNGIFPSDLRWYELPSPEELAHLTVDDLAPVRLGYRARYLIETARCVCEQGLDVLTDDLDSLCGVGPKVASCIRLFGLNQTDSFPIDVWVRRVMRELYDIEKPVAKRYIRRKLNIINELKEENKRLKEQQKKQEDYLKKLAVEYTLLGKECEKEGMEDAAINNYKKAIELYPSAPEAKRRLKKLEKKTGK